MNLNQVTVPSTNLGAAVAFYRLLGLIQIVDATPDYARFECPNGEATFSIQRVDHIAQQEAGPGTVVYFECDDLDAVVADLKTRGIAFESEPRDQEWLWREAHLRDPDGNLICLFFAGNNRRNPPWRTR
jgi:catechol 2,3-dioxygenase-like lactoylglutathione lyase family enzyme